LEFFQLQFTILKLLPLKNKNKGFVLDFTPNELPKNININIDPIKLQFLTIQLKIILILFLNDQNYQ